MNDLFLIRLELLYVWHEETHFLCYKSPNCVPHSLIIVAVTFSIKIRQRHEPTFKLSIAKPTRSHPTRYFSESPTYNNLISKPPHNQFHSFKKSGDFVNKIKKITNINNKIMINLFIELLYTNRRTTTKNTLSSELWIRRLHLLGRRKKLLPPPKGYMALNCFWWWGSRSVALESME